MTNSHEGRRLHGLAEQARESGNFIKALEYTDQAALAYQQDSDLLGLAEVQSSRQSTFKQLYRTTGDPVFLIFEKHAALAAVEIAQKSGQPEALGIPYHNLGKYYFEAKDYKRAVQAFNNAVKSLTSHPLGRHTRASVIADIRGHLFAAQYWAGDKTALDRALQALEDLRKAPEESSYNKNVWISGAHLRIAEMISTDNPSLSAQHLASARKIITSDQRLILRKSQLERLENKIHSSIST
jgi:tetratricopeptide (TPR) repeat protein